MSTHKFNPHIILIQISQVERHVLMQNSHCLHDSIDDEPEVELEVRLSSQGTHETEYYNIDGEEG